MPVRGIRIGILLLALILLAVFAYRAYVEQEGRARLLTGTVEATRVEVGVKESGYIEDLFLHEGMAVRAGADYARGTELLAEGAIAQQAFDALREARDTADANLHAREEEQRLLENGSRPEDIRMAEEDVRRQQAILAMDDSVIDDLTIRIPRDGVVLTKNYEAGEFVRAGASIATLIDPADVWIKIYVTTDMLGGIHLGDPARVYIDGQAEPLTGTIAEISDAAEFTLRQSITKNERANLVFGVKVAVDNAAGILKPGMPADVDLGARHGT